MTRSVEIEVAAREGHGRAVDDEVVPVGPGDALDGADDPLEDRVRQLLLLLLELLVVLDEGRLKLDHLLLPVVDLLLERGLREDLRLLVDLLLLLRELLLPLVQLLLAAVEELLQRRLRAQAVLGLHDRALDVDDGDLHGLGGGACGRGATRRTAKAAASSEAGGETHGAAGRTQRPRGRSRSALAGSAGAPGRPPTRRPHDVVADLHLHRDVLDAQGACGSRSDSRCPKDGSTRLGPDVDRDGVVPGAQRPHVQIVHGDDAREAADDLRGSRRRAGAAAPPRAARGVASRSSRSDPDEEDGRDDEARDRVGRRGPAEADDERGDEGRDARRACRPAGAARRPRRFRAWPCALRGAGAVTCGCVVVVVVVVVVGASWSSGLSGSWACGWAWPMTSCSSHALSPLTKSAMTATTSMMPARGGVCPCSASTPSTTIPRSSPRTSSALKMAATGSARRSPYVKRGVGRRTARRIASRLTAEREHVHQQVQRVGLEHDAVGPDARRRARARRTPPTSASTIVRRRACRASPGVNVAVDDAAARRGACPCAARRARGRARDRGRGRGACGVTRAPLAYRRT